MIVIEKNIPLPTETRGRKSKYPWDKMEIGDSFYCASKGAYVLTARQQKVTSHKYACRRERDGFRVWRIA
jgi:hypothetical protein